MLPSTFLKVVWMAGLGWCVDLRWSHLPSLLASIDKLDAINLTSSSTTTVGVTDTTVRPVRIRPSVVTASTGRPKSQLRRSRMEQGSRPFRGTARFTMSTPGGWEGPTRRPTPLISLFPSETPSPYSSYPLGVSSARPLGYQPTHKTLYPGPPSYPRYAAADVTPRAETGLRDAHSYSFSYDAGDHSRQESSDGYRVVGSWSYVDPEDGVLRRVTYEAGPETGFVAHIEPVLMESLPVLVPSGGYPSPTVRPHPASLYPSSPGPHPSSTVRPYPTRKPYPSSPGPYPSSTVRPYPGEKPFPSGPGAYPSSTVRPHPGEKLYPSSPGPYPSSTVRPYPGENPYPSSPGPFPSSTVRPYPADKPYPSSAVRPYPSSPGPYPSSTIRPHPAPTIPSSTLHPYPPRPDTGTGSRRVLPPLFIPTGEDFSNGYYFDSGLGSPQWGDRLKPRVSPSDPAPPSPWSSPIPEVQYRRSTTVSPNVSRLLSQAVLARSLNPNIQAKHNYAILNEIADR